VLALMQAAPATAREMPGTVPGNNGSGEPISG
jgi:hypothetical protein